MTVHAFVDESERNGTYYLCAAIVEPRWLTPLRKKINGLLLPGQRELHFKKEKPVQRRKLADQIARLPVTTFVYSAEVGTRKAEKVRQQCVMELMRDLHELRANRLVLDTRDDRNRYDRETIHKMLVDHAWRDEFAYEHVASHAEALAWIADVTGWCYGAGGDWRRRIMPIVTKVIDV